jgi:putative flippase GtrA
VKLPGELFRFGVVGSVGFLVDASVLQMLVS